MQVPEEAAYVVGPALPMPACPRCQRWKGVLGGCITSDKRPDFLTGYPSSQEFYLKTNPTQKHWDHISEGENPCRE